MTVSLVLLVAVYWLAVLTTTGQELENAALRGADQAPAAESDGAWSALGDITIWTLAIATALVGMIGLLRRKVFLAVVAVSVIVGGQIVTQVLKRFVLPRPDLVEVSGHYAHNSFPSGHTTIAMTVLVALFLVVPYRWRGVAMFVVMTWAVGIGAYTTTAKWHRFSDTFGADMVALICGAVAALLLLRRGAVTVSRSRPKVRVVYVVAMAVVGAFSLAVGTFIGVASGIQDLRDPIIEWNLYLTANSLATGCSVLSALAYWATWRRLDVRA
ncbi:phosphatase PAP2 family protein [Corynebacterium sp. AOP12-C2-36]|uniref:phosphatase PAP2 family protein n=1 Tax=Corynebacterium sp. AOP12-C2-36 TaxID=3457723 RepID=UPI004033245F